MCRSPAESGLYYLKSRYYDPQICRFINADDVISLGTNGDFISYNLFAYCGNNPVSRIDNCGKDWETFCQIGTALVIVGVLAAITIGTGGAGALVLAGMGVTASAAWATAITGTAIAVGSIVYASTTGGKHSTDKGKEGERQAGIDQSRKKTTEIHGRSRTPDSLTSESLTEVKNVRYISNTLQLRDYAEIALREGVAKRLVVRAGEGTIVARTLLEAGWNIIRLIVN